MAEEVAIAGTPSTAKLRNPWGVIGLTLITLGFYYFFWWYYINREMRDFGRARGVDLGQNPATGPGDLARRADHRPGDRLALDTSDRIQRTQVGRDRTRRKRADRLHPALDHQPGRPLVRPERAEQGVGEAGSRGPRPPPADRGGRDAAATPAPTEAAPEAPRPEAPQ